MVDEKLLTQRNKKKKPDFVVKEAKFSARVKKRWRYPRGKHSKVRQMHKGRQAMPQPGYGAPKAVRGLMRSGLFPVIIKNEKELLAISVGEGAIIASTVGVKKKIALLKLAEEKKIIVTNASDGLAGKLKKEFEERRKKKKDRIVKRSQKDEEKKQKAKKKEEEKKKQDTEEKDAVKSEESVEDKVEDMQKKMVEKTITKRQ